MTVIKKYNAGTSTWETIVVGKQGPRGLAGIEQSATAPEDTSVLWIDTDETVNPFIGPTGPTGPTGPASEPLNTFIQPTAPVGVVGPYLWFQTGTTATLWVEDGT